MIDNHQKIGRAFVSVSDKTDLVTVARALAGYGIELVSTGGTANTIAGADIPVIPVEQLTGFPEMMDGRVKTLHPKVHGGLLAVRGNPEHQAAMEKNGIKPIDLLIVNLYPFEATVNRGANFDDCIENIDIGGPAMIRAAAKNHADVAVIVDPEDYPVLLAELKEHGGATTETFRKKMAAKAYARTAVYDAAIANWFADKVGEETPKFRTFGGTLIQRARYGENPHQKGAFYKLPGPAWYGVSTAKQLQGKELSYNNLNDTDAAYECVAEFDSKKSAACVIVKHANPCGVAEGETLLEAYQKALACDPVSAFGGVIAFNRLLDGVTAAEVIKIFTEVIIVPNATQGAIDVIGKKQNLRLLVAGGLPDPRAAGLVAKTVAGGLLVQSRDNTTLDSSAITYPTKYRPLQKEWDDLMFAWRVVKHVKSNAIVFAKNGATVGIGAGQTNRVDSVRIAIRKAEDEAAKQKKPSQIPGSVLASDAFFPFKDGVEAAIEAGVAAIMQPGGSMRDEEVVTECDSEDIPMVFTGVRHFRH